MDADTRKVLARLIAKAMGEDNGYLFGDSRDNNPRGAGWTCGDTQPYFDAADAVLTLLAAPDDAGEAVACGIAGYFPDSGGWCLQSSPVFVGAGCEISAVAYIVHVLENSTKYKPMPLYSPPPAAAPQEGQGK